MKNIDKIIYSLIILAGCIFTLVSAKDILAAGATAVASEEGLKSDPIRVSDEGAVITDYKSDCAESAWIEKQQNGYNSIYKKFYNLEDLKGFIIENKGTYYIYPVTAHGCEKSAISVTYQNNK